MSFMMHPYPYADPDAVNMIEIPVSVKENLVSGILNVGKKISSLFQDGKNQSELTHIPGLNTMRL